MRGFVRVGLDYDLWADRLLQASAKAEIQRGGPGYVDASFGHRGAGGARR
jgi:hypothetical protein